MWHSVATSNDTIQTFYLGSGQDRVDVMYRDRLADNGGRQDDPLTSSPAKETASTKQAKLTPTPDSTKNDGDPLGQF